MVSIFFSHSCHFQTSICFLLCSPAQFRTLPFIYTIFTLPHLCQFSSPVTIPHPEYELTWLKFFLNTPSASCPSCVTSCGRPSRALDSPFLQVLLIVAFVISLTPSQTHTGDISSLRSAPLLIHPLYSL